MLRTAIALVAFLLAGAASAQDVGTAAAVNQSARGTPPGGAVRTIALGDNIIHNERVATDAGGLVQILFVDGTTLMMGPNSELVIDSFFYDPNAKSAQVAVTMTKGVLRFIGGLTSKSEDGAQIGTPVGTIGIRGGIVDVDLETSDGTPQHIDMLFGTEVTLEQGLALIGRLYQGGYSLVLGGDGNVTVQKTPPEWSSQIQQALAGRPGTSGGSSNPPDDEDVADSGVPDANSGSSLGDLGVPPLTDEEIEQLLAAVATYDELRDFIFEGTYGGDDPPPHGSYMLIGASGGAVTYGFSDMDGPPETYGSDSVLTTGDTVLPTAILSSVTFDANDNAIGGTIDVFTPGECGTECHYTLTKGPDRSSIVLNQGHESEELLVNASVDIRSYDGASLPGGVEPCECAFMRWGYWDAYGEEPTEGGFSTFDLRGAWVAANITTFDELNALEQAGVTASYAGHAVGYAIVDGGTPYLAAGTMSLDWDFGTRTGDMSIQNFDGHSLYVGVNDDYNVGYFYGAAHDTVQAVVRGGFANNGAATAAGVGGDFHWREYDFVNEIDWNAAGVFLGEQVPH